MMNTDLGHYTQELLNDGLRHPDWQIRFAAAEALADLGDDAGVGILQEGVHTQQAFVRDRAVVSLGKFKRQNLTPALTEALSDRDAMVRGHALESLALSCGAAALPHIETALQDPNEFVQEAAVVALSYLGEPGQPLLIAVSRAAGYQHRYPIRLTAAFYLAEKKMEEGLQVLRESLQCGDNWVAFLAAKNLATLNDRSGELQLKKMLQEGNWPDKIAAIDGLLKLGIQEALTSAIYREASMPDLITQVEAIRLLDRFYPEKTAGLLAKVLQTGDDNVKVRALEVIGELKKTHLMRLADGILQKGPEHLRAIAIMSLEKIADAALLPMLWPALEKSHWLVRFQAASVVLKLTRKV
jgi:HEAT repeat protein